MHPRPPRDTYVVRYRKTHVFDVEPAALWRSVERPGALVRMWPWMKEPHLSAEAIEPGAHLSFVIDPPIPYRMYVDALFTRVVPGEILEADITGDLEGSASMTFAPYAGGSRAAVSWTVEMKQRRLRFAARTARPVLMWGHDWAVEVALRAFRRHLEAP